MKYLVIFDFQANRNINFVYPMYISQRRDVALTGFRKF